MNLKHRVALVLFAFCLTCATVLGQNPPRGGVTATTVLSLQGWKDNLDSRTNGVAVVRLLSSGSTNGPKQLRGYLGKTVTLTNAFGPPLVFPERLRLHSQAIKRLQQEIFSKGYFVGGPVTNELRKTDDQVLMTDLLMDDGILVKVDFVPFRERMRIIQGGITWGVAVSGTITGLDYDRKEIRLQVDRRNYQVLAAR